MKNRRGRSRETGRTFAAALASAVVFGLMGVALFRGETVMAESASSGPSAELDEIIARYGSLDWYQARVDYETSSTAGRITTIERTYYELAFDRAGERLVLIGPFWEMMIEKGVVRITTDQLPGGYLETETGESFGGGLLDVLQSVAPMTVSPVLPDLALLMHEPARSKRILVGDPGDAKALKRIAEGFESRGAAGVDLVLLDETGERIVGSSYTSGGDVDSQSSVSFKTTIRAFDEPVAAETFALDLEGKRAFDTIQAWAQASAPLQPHGGRGGGGGGGGGGVVGRDAPPLVLDVLDGERFDLSEAGDDVVVLYFWASWCPPCRVSLPRMNALLDWIEADGVPARVYAVNLEEDEKTARDAMKGLGADMPVLMDRRAEVARMYGALTIPTTVVIHRGKIMRHQIGAAPDMSAMLRAEIEKILAAAEAETEAEAGAEAEAAETVDTVGDPGSS